MSSSIYFEISSELDDEIRRRKEGSYFVSMPPLKIENVQLTTGISYEDVLTLIVGIDHGVEE